MKKTFICLTLSAFLAVVSCGDDDSNDGDLIAVDTNPAEEAISNPETISDNISIENGTRVTGDAPQPTGNLSFTVSNTTQSGFLNNGFDISFDAPDNYAGAYLQIKSNDATPVADYFDVSYFSKKIADKTKQRASNFLSKKSNLVDTEVEIDVNFNDNIPPGKFCYILCIYDDQGNISEPVEICVEVEAWGGNPNLVDTWNYTKRIVNGVTTTIGEEDCSSSFIFCENGTELDIENAYCNTTTSLPITLNADGTYIYTETGKYTDYDYEQSVENCAAVLEEEQDETYTSKGNWAYDEEEGKLTLVEFEYSEVYGDETYQGIEEDGYLIFDGKATVTGSSLVIEGDYEEYEDGSDITYIAEFHFEK